MYKMMLSTPRALITAGLFSALALALAHAHADPFVADLELRDQPIAASKIVYLDSTSGSDGDFSWTASPQGANLTIGSIPGRVPGDIISDLNFSHAIGNPILDNNFLNSSLWNQNWKYTTKFSAQPCGEGCKQMLVFDGVKMGANISLNGHQLGQTVDQFLRYTFDVTEFLVDGDSNVLEVAFDSSIDCGGRWMACSGGWDWAPYSQTSQEGATTFSKGIWKSVYLASVESVAITHVVPQVTYLGSYPTQMLNDSSKGDFSVSVRVHLWSPIDRRAIILVSGSWGQSETAHVEIPAGDSNTTLHLPASASHIKLWWPTGVGSQTMYDLEVSVKMNGNVDTGAVTTNRSIGFRHIVLVTGNDTDPDFIRKAETEEGTELHGMMFRVNGAVLFARGANVIPTEELEGWYKASVHTELVKSSVAANINMLRVWGGGVYLPQVFYDTCDRLGVLVFHDAMYAQKGHAPLSNGIQDMELRHNIRRLSAHPSIVLYDGCNECVVDMQSPTSIYATFVMRVIAEEDSTRVIWPSCPADGWTKGVHKLTSFPNGNALSTPDKSTARCTTIPNATCIEIHRPKWKGTGDGFKTVNSVGSLAPTQFPKVGPPLYGGVFPSDIPLNLTETQTGPQFRNLFSSESPGATAFSSFESMAGTLSPEHWGVHGGNDDSMNYNVMNQRNYANDNFIVVYFGNGTRSGFNSTGELLFKKQLYWSMIGQALVIKQNIETTRSINRFGTMVWQLNEIWPTGGWGSIEYGNPSIAGQSLGGRWKPLHYWYKSSIFTDIMATCDGKGLCYVKNDSPWPFEGRLQLNVTGFSTGKTNTILDRKLNLPAGAGTIQWFTNEDVARIDGKNEILEAIIMNDSQDIMSHNTIPFATPEHMNLVSANLSVVAKIDEKASLIYAEVSGSALAMYVTLTTLAHGRFENNAFLFHPPMASIFFYPIIGKDAHSSMQDAFAAFAKSLRVEDVALYQNE